jgi:hypothetical protein
VPEKPDPISSWFIAAEELGEFIGIRFGQLLPGSSEPEWTFLSHSEVDGIGGFAELLRERGASLPQLPQIKHPSAPSLLPLLRTWAKYTSPRHPLRWNSVEGSKGSSSVSTPPEAVAWHVFDEQSTMQIRRVCRKVSVTVNSFLLKHLTKAIRPFLRDQSAEIPWMVPVNMRGKVVREKDTGNYSSYVGIKVRSYENARDIHKSIYAALGRGEHWANWYAYQSGRFLTRGIQKYLIRTEKCTSQWNLGGFSNLGDWDSEKLIRNPACAGPWIFCPPVLRCQLLGAGCVTFQNRLSLAIQVHPELTTASDTLEQWITNWVKEIELDLASILTDGPKTTV